MQDQDAPHMRPTKAAALWAIHRFPKGSIWQTRYVCLPLAIVASTLALSHSELSTLARASWFMLGILSWTFLEYLIHRFVFHYQPRSTVGKALLERFHILHHDDPDDQSQVCIPVAAAGIFWLALFGLFVAFGGNPQGSLLVTCGIALMMVIYDIAHFSTHYMKAGNGFLRMLKKHHMQHHFANHGTRFGVTSPLWDYVFRTAK